eukprot:1149377-Amphidinium_carterae.1
MPRTEKSKWAEKPRESASVKVLRENKGHNLLPNAASCFIDSYELLLFVMWCHLVWGGPSSNHHLDAAFEPSVLLACS